MKTTTINKLAVTGVVVGVAFVGGFFASRVSNPLPDEAERQAWLNDELNTHMNDAGYDAAVLRQASDASPPDCPAPCPEGDGCGEDGKCHPTCRTDQDCDDGQRCRAGRDHDVCMSE